ncbi:IclR family transcriptional regulator [Mesorhizobium sp. BAC0120]|uniref:IclR family transcriptional regulator n=1 Tax=Mesorhizobium sp. BAC0120 TaxID=3090670 RepID=UPI00298CE86B|nr:IclR family transcriptional regulator [Mesorhizobium sp. BAC0120]MDW6024845.1 IclR family transcriptional regulator [Mesorhizobium sp. BAC0120]
MAKRQTVPDRIDEIVTYRAPALEKGLDVLELLAGQQGGLILSQIAHSLDRSVQEVYRVVVSLERRGYVTRRPPSDEFFLSMKLFDLACNYPPTRILLDAAQPVLQMLATRINESVILSVLDGLRVRVVAVADNPAPIGFRVRLGTQSRLLTTASGRTLLAFQNERQRASMLETLVQEHRTEGSDPAPLLKRIKRIAERGYEVVADETLRGITDVSFPILDRNGIAQAALTMPFVLWVTNQVRLADASQHLYEAASSLNEQIGGRLPVTDFSLDEQ